MIIMKSANIFLTLLLSCCFLISAPVYARRQTPEPQDIWAQTQDVDFENHNIEPHLIDRIMNRIEQNDPQLAEDLNLLRRENPEEFHERIRDLIRDRMDRRRDRIPGQNMNPERPRRRNRKMNEPLMHNPPNRPGANGPASRWLTRQWNEFKQWFHENYPSHAEKLENLQKNDPEAALRELKLIYRKYRPIMRAQQENPELAEILEQDLMLKNHRNEIMTELRIAQGHEKQQLKQQLKQIVSERFDLIVRKKELQYQDLKERLEDLKQEVAKRQAEVEKMESKKDKAVDQRIQDLIGKTESINWD